MKYVMHFRVVGRGFFPVDMLRYDQCWPTGQDDAANMIVDSVSLNAELRTIELSKWCRNQQAEPTTDRWASFGWQVQGKPIYYKI